MWEIIFYINQILIKKLNILSAGIGKDIIVLIYRKPLKQFNVNKLIMIDPTEVAY